MKKFCKDAVALWGVDIQTIIAIEELAELMHELAQQLQPSCPDMQIINSLSMSVKLMTKVFRQKHRITPLAFPKKGDNKAAVVEEIVDCLIMTTQMKEIYVNTPEMKKVFADKLLKAENRVKDAQREQNEFLRFIKEHPEGPSDA